MRTQSPLRKLCGLSGQGVGARAISRLIFCARIGLGIITSHMKKATLQIVTLLLFTASGCDQLNPPDRNKAALAQKAKSAPRPPLHRFVLTRDADVAFDTQTGQICRTWPWQPTGQTAKPDPASGNVPQRQLGEFAPTCLDLYRLYPSGPDDGTPTSADEQGLQEKN